MAYTVGVKYFNSFWIKRALDVTANVKWPGLPWNPQGYPTFPFGGSTFTTGYQNYYIEESRIKGGFNNAQVTLGVRAYVVNENKDAIDNTVVLDLFCGTGTIGQIVASKSNNAKIVGVDIVASAIADAKENAKRNNIKGLEFYAADVGKFLTEHPEFKNKIRTIILDPARAGIAPKTLKKIINLAKRACTKKGSKGDCATACSYVCVPTCIMCRFKYY